MKNILFIVLLFTASCISAQELKATLTQAHLKVSVIDDKKNPQAGQSVTFTSAKDGKVFSGTTDANGKFEMLIPPAQTYKVKYHIFNTDYDDQDMEMPSSERPYTFEYTLEVTPPKTFTLNNVFFDSGKSTLRPESNKELNQLAEFLSLKKTTVIEISGHTDNVGNDELNQTLSESRAKAVYQYLIANKIEAARLVYKGYGASQCNNL